MTQRDMFFSFEGIDGSGKSTQAKLLATELERRGKTVCRVREPGGSPLGEAIRGILLDQETDIVPRAELLLFSAARTQLVDTVIKPALARGEIVVADRFYDSSTAYQGAGRQVADLDWFSTFHGFVVDGISPDRTYWLAIDPTIARERVQARSGDDRIESAGTEFFERAAIGYETIAESEPGRVSVLDATASAGELHIRILRDALKWAA